MPSTVDTHREQSDELESALQSISRRWHGNLAAYLNALANAKRAAEATEETRESVPSAGSIARSAKRR